MYMTMPGLNWSVCPILEWSVNQKASEHCLVFRWPIHDFCHSIIGHRKFAIQMLQLDCAVVLRCFNRNFSIKVAQHDCSVMLTAVHVNNAISWEGQPKIVRCLWPLSWILRTLYFDDLFFFLVWTCFHCRRDHSTVPDSVPQYCDRNITPGVRRDAPTRYSAKVSLLPGPVLPDLVIWSQFGYFLSKIATKIGFCQLSNFVYFVWKLFK